MSATINGYLVSLEVIRAIQAENARIVAEVNASLVPYVNAATAARQGQPSHLPAASAAALPPASEQAPEAQPPAPQRSRGAGLRGIAIRLAALATRGLLRIAGKQHQPALCAPAQTQPNLPSTAGTALPQSAMKGNEGGAAHRAGLQVDNVAGSSRQDGQPVATSKNGGAQ